MLAILLRALSILLLAIFFGVSAIGAQDAPQRTIQMKAATVSDCSTAKLANAIGTEPGQMSASLSEQLMTWCRGQQAAEKAAEARASRLWAARGPKAPNPTDLAMDDETLALWCGRNNCLCWKGKKYDGCHHTDIMCRPNTFKCVGKVCGCTTVE